MVQEQNKDQDIENIQSQDVNATSDNMNQQSGGSDTTLNSGQDEVDILKNEVGELKDKYLRLYSEFDNFRRRTAKEKTEFFKTANEDLMTSLLPVLDDFERAHKALTEAKSSDAVIEGINLIYNKLFNTLQLKGLKPMNTLIGEPFNSELQEAITSAPAPSEDLKGKVIDVVEKGYLLNDKVIRFAKVIIGA
jgi:molecular chaperone GrpE